MRSLTAQTTHPNFTMFRLLFRLSCVACLFAAGLHAEEDLGTTGPVNMDTKAARSPQMTSPASPTSAATRFKSEPPFSTTGSASSPGNIPTPENPTEPSAGSTSDFWRASANSSGTGKPTASCSSIRNMTAPNSATSLRKCTRISQKFRRMPSHLSKEIPKI